MFFVGEKDEVRDKTESRNIARNKEIMLSWEKCQIVWFFVQ